MRWIIAIAGLATALPLHAQNAPQVEATVLIERAGEHGLRVEPAARFVRGDKVVTVLRWSGPRRSGSTIINAVPPALALESTSGDALQVSTDGGRSWTVLTDPDRLPQGVTHLRWPAGQGAGTLTYRAVVR